MSADGAFHLDLDEAAPHSTTGPTSTLASKKPPLDQALHRGATACQIRAARGHAEEASSRIAAADWLGTTVAGRQWQLLSQMTNDNRTACPSVDIMEERLEPCQLPVLNRTFVKECTCTCDWRRENDRCNNFDDQHPSTDAFG